MIGNSEAAMRRNGEAEFIASYLLEEETFVWTIEI